MLTIKENGGENYHIIRSLHARDGGSYFTPCDPGLVDDAALLDALHGKLLARLSLMRDLCVKVIHLPMTNRARGECQARVEGLIADIDKLAVSIKRVVRGDAASRADLLREVESVDASILTVVNRIDATQGNEKNLQRRSETPSRDATVFGPKFDAWMKSILGDSLKNSPTSGK